MNTEHSNLGHLFTAEISAHGWQVGGENENMEHLSIVGQRILLKAIDLQKIKNENVKEVNLKRFTNHFINDTIKTDTLLIYKYEFTNK